MEKIYVYDEFGVVTSILNRKYYQDFNVENMIVSNNEFEHKEGFMNILKVNLSTKELYCEYVERPLTQEERIIQLEKELDELKASLKQG